MSKAKKYKYWKAKRLQELRDQHQRYRDCLGALAFPEKYRRFRRKTAKLYAELRDWKVAEDV